MQGQVYSGQLTSIDTEAGKIEVRDKTVNEEFGYKIDEDTKLPGGETWESLMGEDIEVIVIDGKTKGIRIVEEE